MRVAKFMIPKDIAQPSYVFASSEVHDTQRHCAALLGHAHVCAYTRIALNLMRSLNGAYPNRLRKKRIYAKEYTN